MAHIDPPKLIYPHLLQYPNLVPTPWSFKTSNDRPESLTSFGLVLDKNLVPHDPDFVCKVTLQRGSRSPNSLRDTLDTRVRDAVAGGGIQRRLQVITNWIADCALPDKWMPSNFMNTLIFVIIIYVYYSFLWFILINLLLLFIYISVYGEMGVGWLGIIG